MKLLLYSCNYRYNTTELFTPLFQIYVT